jgi:dihydrofolate reductase
MRRLLLNLTTSLDGFVADSDEGIDWIQPPPESIPADYLELMETVDALVMGRATYELSLRVPGGLHVFEHKRAYVVTSRSDLEPREGIEFVREDPVAFVERLKQGPGGTIWLFGGGRLATALSTAGLIDDYLIVIQPVLLGEGIPLWQDGLGLRELTLTHAGAWPGGLVEVRYRPRF